MNYIIKGILRLVRPCYIHKYTLIGGIKGPFCPPPALRNKLSASSLINIVLPFFEFACVGVQH